MMNLIFLLAACAALIFLCLTDLSALPGILLLSLLVYFFSFRWYGKKSEDK